MAEISYEKRRSELEVYFDKTAASAWEKLTSDAPVGTIRATVRAGRDQMRNTLLDWLPEDLQGCRLLDAGCGTGTFSIEAARRGADVVAIDLSQTLVSLAEKNYQDFSGPGSLEFRIGDFLSKDLGEFDYVIAMDSLIHYQTEDIVNTLASLSGRTNTAILFTYAPKTPALTAMHLVGRLFPRGNRAPAIVPASQRHLHQEIQQHPAMNTWSINRNHKVAAGFYISAAQELVRS